MSIVSTVGGEIRLLNPWPGQAARVTADGGVVHQMRGDIVVFPTMVVPLFVGRDKSVSALEKAMSTDKKTIGVTKENRDFLDFVIERKLFNDQIDAAKLGLSLAVRKGVEAGEAAGVDTKWNVGSFDTDGHLRGVLTALYPDVATPYRLAEHFINEGLRLLCGLIEENPELDIAKLQEALGA